MLNFLSETKKFCCLNCHRESIIILSCERKDQAPAPPDFPRDPELQTYINKIRCLIDMKEHQVESHKLVAEIECNPSVLQREIKKERGNDHGMIRDSRSHGIRTDFPYPSGSMQHQVLNTGGHLCIRLFLQIAQWFLLIYSVD